MSSKQPSISQTSASFKVYLYFQILLEAVCLQSLYTYTLYQSLNLKILQGQSERKITKFQEFRARVHHFHVKDLGRKNGNWRETVSQGRRIFLSRLLQV